MVVCSFVVDADPLNVLVGDLTFNRPEQWNWESPADKSKALTRFIIPSDAGKSTADVRFYLTDKSPSVAAALWKSYFPNAKAEDLWEEKKKIGSHEVTYISVSGTHVFPGAKAKPNFTFFGAVIPSGDSFVHVRLFGPRGEVQKATEQFRKMVEDALRE